MLPLVSAGLTTRARRSSQLPACSGRATDHLMLLKAKTNVTKQGFRVIKISMLISITDY